MRLSLILVAGLAACTPSGDVVTDLSREAARQAVRPVLADRFPGIPLEPATDCVIDNASAGEILTLAKGAALGASAETTDVIVKIASRPETLKCFAEDGLPALLRNL